MASHARRGRWIRIAIIAVLSPTVCLITVVRIQQYVLRWRAERLLTDIRQIQMGKSTWADAQRLMNRWGKWGLYEGSCDARSCDYEIMLQDASHAFPVYFQTEKSLETRAKGHEYPDWQLRLYSLLGGRPAQIYAETKTRNGIIWTKSFDVMIANWRKIDPGSTPYFDPLVGMAEGVTHLHDFSPDHPEYWIDTGQCSGCVLVWTEFTPQTDAETLKKLLDINLSCLTRLNRCQREREIMPAAFAIAKAEEVRPQSWKLNDFSCKIPLELAVRDARYVAIAEVVSIRAVKNSEETVWVATFQSIQSLKNHAYVGPLLFRHELALRPETILPGGVPASRLRTGDKMILLFDVGPDEPDAISLEDTCGFIPYSPDSMAVVQRGIALDAIPERY
jgi:hypothetical protein